MNAFLALEESWATVALSVAWKSVAILAAAWAIALSLRRSTAAARHLAWSLALIGSLVCPS